MRHRRIALKLADRRARRAAKRRHWDRVLALGCAEMRRDNEERERATRRAETFARVRALETQLGPDFFRDSDTELRREMREWEEAGARSYWTFDAMLAASSCTVAGCTCNAPWHHPGPSLTEDFAFGWCAGGGLAS